jgi:hypothetical protein
MTLKEYIKELKKLEKLYPNAQLVYSSDDEGNSFEKVHMGPTAGMFEGREFGGCKPDEVNAICIN